MRRQLAAATASLVLLALGGVPAGAQDGDLAAPDAVVAVVDTGINPYHTDFRDSSARAYQHPSTYIDGFPADIPALNLTLDAEDYDSAVAADCATWATVDRGEVYWIPGTRIVAAVSFTLGGSPVCEDGALEGARILDSGGHGTMTSSRALGDSYGACPDCLLVSVQYQDSVNLVNPGGSTAPNVEAIRWAASHADWIDLQSNSWGPIVPGWDPTGQAGLLTASPALVQAVEEVSQTHLAFWASGNGAAFRGGVLGHPTPATPHLTPSAISVGGHDSGFVNTWPGFPPHLVSDSCSSWAAAHDSIDRVGDTIGGGTSAATPFVAGGAAAILLDARTLLGDTSTGIGEGGVVASGPAGLVPNGPLSDGTFTMEEWRRVLMTTATARPTAQVEDGPPCEAGPYMPTPLRWADVPAGYPEYLHIGYGAVDRPALALAAQVLRGEAAQPDRAATDQYFAVDGTVRGATHEVFATDPL